MNDRSSRIVYGSLAMLAAAAATFVCVWLMTALNRRIALAAPESACIRCVMLEETGPKQRESQPTPDRTASEPQQEIMTVDLDAPTPPMPSVSPLDLNVALPTPAVDAVRIAVRPARPGNSSPAPSAAAMTALRPTGAATVHDANRVDQPPRESAGNPKPKYPAREEALGIEGTVRVHILIDERGRVEDVQVVSGPEAFRRAVLEVIRTLRFEPARHEGKAVKVWAKNKDFNFKHPRNRR